MRAWLLVVVLFALLAAWWRVSDLADREGRTTAPAPPAVETVPERPEPVARPAIEPERPRAPVEEPSAEPTEEPAEGLTVEGRVLHAFSRAPVAGARVAAWDTDAPMDFPAVRETDEEGRFVVAGLRRNQPLALVASAAGFVPVRVQHTVTEPVRDIEILVGGGGIVGGRVVGGDGRPVAGRPAYLVETGAPVPLVDEVRGGGAATLSSSLALPRTDTGPDGSYLFRGVPLGRAVEVVVNVSQSVDARSEPATFARDGEHLVRDIQVRRPARLRVVVKDAAGEPLPNVQVDLTTESGDRFRLPEDAEGAAEVAPGRTVVQVFPEGAPPMEQTVELRDGEEREVEFRLPGGGIVEGVVVAADGMPLWMAFVGWADGHGIATTDEKGRFRLHGDRPGTLNVSGDSAMGLKDGTVVRDDASHGSVSLPNVVPGGKPLRIVLPRGALLRGRIVGPRAGTEVQTRYISDALGGGQSFKLPADGTFRHGSTRAGERFLLLVKAPGFAPFVREAEPLAPGETRDLGEIRLDKGVIVAGTVRDADGRPVARARVLVAEPWTDVSTRTGSGGAFRFRRMPRKRLHLRVEAKGYPAHYVVHEPERRPVYTIGRGGLVRVRLLDAHGTPRTGDVIFEAATPGFHRDKTMEFVRSRPDGVVGWRLAQGPYLVSMWSETKRELIRRPFEIRAGETTEVELSVP